MFFIVNHEDSIIGADADFLESLGAKDIYEIALSIKEGEIQLEEEGKSIHYLQTSRIFSKRKISTFFGDIFLYEVTDEEVEKDLASYTEAFQLSTAEEKSSEDIQDTDSHFDNTETEEDKGEEPLSDEVLDALLNNNDDDIILLKDNTDTSIEEDIEEEKIDLSTIQDDELFSLAINQEEDTISVAKDEDDNIQTKPLELEEETSLSVGETLGIIGTGAIANELLNDTTDIDKGNIDLLEELAGEPLDQSHEPLFSLYDETQEEVEEVDPHLTLKIEDELPIESHLINTEEIASLIGISEEEYIHFLDDFSKESSKLEESLLSNNLKESREATSILKEASLLLHLPHIAEKLDELTNATSDEKENTITSYLKLLSATAVQSTIEETKEEPEEEESLEIDTAMTSEQISLTESEDIDPFPMPLNLEEDIEDTFLSPSDPEELLTPKIREESTFSMDDTKEISLENIQPIPFDFSINEAADELTLPSSLVSEFIIDFINQAKENIPVLQKSYQEKDLDAIQKTAHMLKGASSNLRITPMADTLYNLQFNDNLEKVPELLEFFTGQLKALSMQMDQLS